MSFPEPRPGLVIRYDYLWRDEHVRGQEEGLKHRPCAIIVATQDDKDNSIVTVLPITHTPPFDPLSALALPTPVKLRLGLDHDRSWIMLSEANRFLWPGPDLHPSVPAYGYLPRGLFRQMRERFIELLKAKAASIVPRTE